MHIKILQTLADPTRFCIVEALMSGEDAVNGIVNRVGIHQSGVSRHLRILQELGFVQVRPEGQKRIYSLRSEPFSELETWASRYRQLWEARLDRFGVALTRKSKARQTKIKKATK